MTDRLYSRMTRYAAFAAAHGLLVVAWLVVETGWYWILVGAVGLGFLLAWGPYHAHLTLNAGIDEGERYRWRMALWLLPWSIAAYWYLHVRR